MRRNRLKATAYHEASHAVIARVLTLACDSATIEPDADSAGHSICHDPWACIYQWEKRGKVRGDTAVWHARIIAFMAGGEAEAELLGLTAPGDGEDRRQIEQMAEQFGLDEGRRNKVETRLRAMTRILIRRHKGRIERVAKALLARTTLSADELDNLVGKSVDDVKVNAPFLLEMHRQLEGSA
jgi:ATP-dependent Zn protease